MSIIANYQATFKFTHVQPLFTGLTFRLEVDVALFNSKRVRARIICLRCFVHAFLGDYAFVFAYVDDRLSACVPTSTGLCGSCDVKMRSKEPELGFML